MNLDTDPLVISSRLSLPLADAQHLPLEQTKSLVSLLRSFEPPLSLTELPSVALAEALQAEGLSRTKGTISFRGLLSCLSRQGITLTTTEQSCLLTSLSHSPKTYLVSLPLFLALHRYWSAHQGSPSIVDTEATAIASTFDAQKVRALIELEAPHLLPILELVFQRSQYVGSPWNHMKIVSISYFQELLHALEVRTSKEIFAELIRVLSDTGICTHTGEIHLPRFLSIADHQKPWQLRTSIIDTNMQMTVLSPTSHRLWSNITSSGILIMRKLLEDRQANKKYVTEESMNSALRLCGIQLGANDLRELWMTLILKNNPNCLGDIRAGGGGQIPIEVFAKNIGVLDLASIWPAPPAPYKSQEASQKEPLIAALMRDDTNIARSKKACNSNSSNTTTIGNCFQMPAIPPTPPTITPPTPPSTTLVASITSSFSSSASSSSSSSLFIDKPPQEQHNKCLPWQKKEDDNISNVVARVRSRLVDGSKVLSVITGLRKREVESANSLSRYILTETLAMNGVRLSGGDAENIWAAFLQFCSVIGERPTTDNFSLWMSFGAIAAPHYSSSSSPPSFSSVTPSIPTSTLISIPEFPKTSSSDDSLIRDGGDLVSSLTSPIRTGRAGSIVQENANHYLQETEPDDEQKSPIFTRPKSTLSMSKTPRNQMTEFAQQQQQQQQQRQQQKQQQTPLNSTFSARVEEYRNVPD